VNTGPIPSGIDRTVMVPPNERNIMSTFVLVPGMWIGAWAWRSVTAELRAAGHEVYPLTLTGVADRAHLAGATLDTHVEDIVRLIEVEDLRDVVLVGHSYGGFPVTVAAERIPDRLGRLVYLDSGPLPAGTRQADQLEPQSPTGDTVPPRPWDPAADPVLLAGLDKDALDQLRTRSTPHPLGSVAQPIPRTGAGLSTPTTLVTCTFPLDQVREMIAADHPWFAELRDADVIALPTGHWPMLSEPTALARILGGL
jgi:pimeloyl-ACP methyl ester carboxylesterase